MNKQPSKKLGEDSNKVFREENDLLREETRVQMTLDGSRRHREEYPDRSSWAVVNLICEEIEVTRETMKGLRKINRTLLDENAQLRLNNAATTDRLFSIAKTISHLTIRGDIYKSRCRVLRREVQSLRRPWYVKLKDDLKEFFGFFVNISCGRD